MAVTQTSGTWTVAQWTVPLENSLDDVSYDGTPDALVIATGAIQSIERPENTDEGIAHLTKYSSTFTTDAAEPFEFHMGACGEAIILVDGVEIGRLDSASLPGAATATCPATGAPVCLCQTQNQYDIEDFSVDLSAGEHTLEVIYLAHPASNGIAVDWTPGDTGRQTLDLTIPETFDTETDAEGDGEWGEVIDWPIIPIHSIVLPDGNILTFGTNEAGVQGAQFVYDVYNPETDTHYTLPNTAGTDIFCSQMVLDPKSGNVIIMGGDVRGDPNLPGVNKGVDDITVFNTKTYAMESADDDLIYERWYASVTTLSDGTILTLGGSNSTGQTSTIPEIYDSETGPRALTDAAMPSMNRSYARVWENSNGEVIVIESAGREIFKLDTEGTGSVTKIGVLPFNTNWLDPGVMFDQDQVLMIDRDGGLWEGDISGSTPSFVKTAQLPAGRTNGQLLMAEDGTVLVIGGTEDNSTGTGLPALQQAQKYAVRYDPDTNEFDVLASEELGRLYHSTGTVLPDGRILSAGGGAPGPLKNLNAQIFRPESHYDENGNLAERPVIEDAPSNIDSGETFLLDVDNALEISTVGALRSGGNSHSNNSDARFLELDFKIIDTNTIEVTAVDGNVMLPGLWMVSVTDNDGVPSEASLIGVDMAPIGEPNADTVFETTATARFDDLDAGPWQRVFDFGNGPADDNILLSQEGATNNMTFHIYDGASGPATLTAQNAIVEGETATWTAAVDETGLMQIYKNGSLIAQGPGIVPNDVDRSSNLVGKSNWEADTDLVGEVLFIEHSDIGGEITEPDDGIAFDAIVTARFDDLSDGAWQSIYDFTDGPDMNNVTLGQNSNSNDMAFHIYRDGEFTKIVAKDVIIEGEVAQWRTTVDDEGYMELYKNGELVAEGQGQVPADIVRPLMLIGGSSWPDDNPLNGEVFGIWHTEIGGTIDPPIGPPIDPPEVDLMFDATVTVRFDDVDGGDWQPVFDFGAGLAQDNILLTQFYGRDDMAFYVFDGSTSHKIVAKDSITEGETATWRTTVDENGKMSLYKNGELLVSGAGVVPNDVERDSMYVGQSNWPSDTPLIGEVIAIEHSDVGGEIIDPDEPPSGDLVFSATALARFDDIEGGDWQAVFDFGDGQAQDNILLTQHGGSTDMTFYVFDGSTAHKITAEDVLVDGELAEWRTTVDDSGYMELYKNGALVAEGQGVVPNDVDRDAMWVGRTSWPGDTPLIGEVLKIEHTDVGGEISDPDDAETLFEVEAVVQFDDLDGAAWQPIVDFGNGPDADNISLTQAGITNDMALYVYDGDKASHITAFGVIEEGETATWNASVNSAGKMEIYKDGTLVASGYGHAPNDVVRENMLVGESNWEGEGPLIGKIHALKVSELPDGSADDDSVEAFLADFPTVDVPEEDLPEIEEEDLVA